MTVRRRFTILGCGSSPGTPRINGDWGACDPNNPRNRRRRAAMLVEQFGPDGTTTVAVDAGPDFREQMIDAGVRALDAVILTHAHADHMHGIDDVRGYAVVDSRRRIPVHGDAATLTRLNEAFGYAIKTPHGSQYPPIIAPHEVAAGSPLVIAGAGGDIVFQTLKQIHGDIISLGLRIDRFAYCCDVSGFPDETVEALRGVDTLVIDALQYKRHPSHFSVQEALQWIEKLGVRQAYLTHMHVPLDYATLKSELPRHVAPAHDMLTIDMDGE